MKQNPCPVVGEVSEPTGVGLDQLDGTVEALSAGVADFVVAVAPELGEVLLDAPRPAGFQVELVQCPKGNSLSAAAIGILSQPRPLAARQWRCACLGQPAVFLLSDSIDCLTEVLSTQN